MGTGLTCEHDVERGDPIRDQLPSSSPGIVSKQADDVGGKCWLGVLICGRGRRCGLIVDGHLEDKCVIRLFLVSPQRTQDFREVIHTGQIQETEHFFELCGSEPPLKHLRSITVAFTCFSIHMLGQLFCFTGSMLGSQVSAQQLHPSLKCNT